MLTLRPYQEKLISEARQALRSTRNICLQAPTGSGKTVLMAYMLGGARDKGLRSWFIVHRVELLRQSVDEFLKFGLSVGVVSAGMPMDHGKSIQVCSIQTLVRRLDKLAPPTFIAIDECHHATASSWSKVLHSYPDAFRVGLTATPERLDGTGLRMHFNEMIEGPTVKELIAQGYLSDYKMFAPSRVDTKGLRVRMGDYVTSDMEELVDKPTITGDAVHHYKKLCPGARALAFCISVKHSKHVCSEFNKAGIRAEHVDGTTNKQQRKESMDRFKSGETRVLTSVELFGEGVDVPAMEAAILLRPTKSLCLYLQQVGRALRPYEGKTAIILDHVGNHERHGLPDDDREWSLDSKKGHR